MSSNLSIAALIATLKREPAAAGYGLVAALVPLLTMWQGWDVKQAGAASAIGVALASAVAAVKARPVSPPVLLGGASAIATALAAWHVKIPAADMAWITSAVTTFLGAHMRANLTPVVALKPPSRLP